MNYTLLCTQAYTNTRAHVYVGVCVSVYACVRLCVCVCACVSTWASSQTKPPVVSSRETELYFLSGRAFVRPSSASPHRPSPDFPKRSFNCVSIVHFVCWKHVCIVCSMLPSWPGLS